MLRSIFARDSDDPRPWWHFIVWIAVCALTVGAWFYVADHWLSWMWS